MSLSTPFKRPWTTPSPRGRVTPSTSHNKSLSPQSPAVTPVSLSPQSPTVAPVSRILSTPDPNSPLVAKKINTTPRPTRGPEWWNGFLDTPDAKNPWDKNTPTVVHSHDPDSKSRDPESPTVVHSTPNPDSQSRDQSPESVPTPVPTPAPTCVHATVLTPDPIRPINAVDPENGDTPPFRGIIPPERYVIMI